jgi:hypothetical protein
MAVCVGTGKMRLDGSSTPTSLREVNALNAIDFTKWLEAFNSYVPVQQAENEFELHEAANSFLRAFIGCPARQEQLVAEYMKRQPAGV